MLIIWGRNVKKVWLGIMFICFILFEILQCAGAVKGTGDIVDIVFYVGFATSALLINKFIRK